MTQNTSKINVPPSQRPGGEYKRRTNEQKAWDAEQVEAARYENILRKLETNSKQIDNSSKREDLKTKRLSNENKELINANKALQNEIIKLRKEHLAEQNSLLKDTSEIKKQLARYQLQRASEEAEFRKKRIKQLLSYGSKIDALTKAFNNTLLGRSLKTTRSGIKTTVSGVNGVVNNTLSTFNNLYGAGSNLVNAAMGPVGAQITAKGVLANTALSALTGGVINPVLLQALGVNKALAGLWGATKGISKAGISATKAGISGIKGLWGLGTTGVGLAGSTLGVISNPLGGALTGAAAGTYFGGPLGGLLGGLAGGLLGKGLGTLGNQLFGNKKKSKQNASAIEETEVRKTRGILESIRESLNKLVKKSDEDKDKSKEDSFISKLFSKLKSFVQITGLVAATSVVGYFLSKNWDKIKPFVDKAVELAKPVITSAMQKITPIITEGMGFIVDAIKLGLKTYLLSEWPKLGPWIVEKLGLDNNRFDNQKRLEEIQEKQQLYNNSINTLKDSGIDTKAIGLNQNYTPIKQNTQNYTPYTRDVGDYIPLEKDSVAQNDAPSSFSTKANLTNGHVPLNRSFYTRNDLTNTPEYILDNVQAVRSDLIDPLQSALDKNGNDNKVTVTSSYRNPKYNQQVGGVSRSKHLTGRAVDIQVSGMNPNEVIAFMQQNNIPFDRAIMETSGNTKWLHVEYDRSGNHFGTVAKIDARTGKYSMVDPGNKNLGTPDIGPVAMSTASSTPSIEATTSEQLGNIEGMTAQTASNTTPGDTYSGGSATGGTSETPMVGGFGGLTPSTGSSSGDIKSLISALGTVASGGNAGASDSNPDVYAYGDFARTLVLGYQGPAV